MQAKRFPSKVDRWIVVVLVAGMILQLAALVSVTLTEKDKLPVVILVVTTLFFFLLVGSVLVFTYYSVAGDQLKIVCGPFRWRVPIDEIHSVEATRNPLSSPALSLDRLRITYGNDRKIMVSPADKAGFLKAIGQSVA